MDLTILKKKLSTYRTEGGYLKDVGDDLLIEILAAWEEWTGPSSGFYKALGVDYRKMATLMGRAKKLKREGAVPDSGFKEVKLASREEAGDCADAIILSWEKGQVIRFRQVDHLVEFLKKVAA